MTTEDIVDRLPKFSRHAGTACAFLVTAVFLSSPVAQATSPRPSIVLILSDDHSAPHLGSYGNSDLKTPNLDSLASQGTRFTRAYTTAPQCVLSRASLMTGRSAVAIRMTRFTAALPRQIITYPEILRSNGYYTGLLGRYHHLDGPLRKTEIGSKVFEEQGLATFEDRVDFIANASDAGVLDVLRSFLSEVPKSKPFFVQIGFSDPHRPFTAKEHVPDYKTIEVPPTLPDSDAVRKDLAAYYGEVQRLDFHIGQVITELKERDLYDNTLIVFMGDNGAALLGGKGSLYELGLKVPLIVRWPGHNRPGAVIDALISGEDIAPTFLDAAGASIPDTMTGISMKALLEGKESNAHQYIFAVRGSHASRLPTDSASFDLSRAVISKRYKLIYNATWRQPYRPVDFHPKPLWKELVEANRKGKIGKKFGKYFTANRPLFQFFDLETDPGETENLSEKWWLSNEIHAFKEALQEWMILNQDYLPLPLKATRP